MNLGLIHSSTGSGLLICGESTVGPKEEPRLPSTSAGETAKLTVAVAQAPTGLQGAHGYPSTPLSTVVLSEFGSRSPN